VSESCFGMSTSVVIERAMGWNLTAAHGASNVERRRRRRAPARSGLAGLDTGESPRV